MPHYRTAPQLFGSPGDDVDTVINWGLGVDSTTEIVEILDDPAAHDIDLTRTAVIHMATGSEWPRTRELADIGKPGNQNLRNAPSRAEPPHFRRGVTFLRTATWKKVHWFQVRSER
ncbi:hypothetical protein SLUN_00110 [Streptomyces lunaelactis]|uniref:Uncharacterized protein n=1 Tax=Streptomyces lunaelactis TaxID=1535768 RepID=A0A2R4SVL7_9ACTN|nr:hypothetical protein [Streptomyces lunaelactis]AVZ70908.1 hypothetical protein SLUN_00110 [Streptomyces lunaelactis]NUK25164.1 hypothetical protein [Streptomyces lunaelactis]NUK85625.1 hypothetical protein [Streptomyces lunaelactis]